MKKLLLFLSSLCILLGCNTEKCDKGSIYQLSYQHGSGGRADCDSIVLDGKDDVESFGKIFIYRRDKLIFIDTSKNLQVVGMPYNLFVEQEITFQKEYYYIFRLLNAPDPYNYLIVKTTPDTTFVFGETEPSSSEIFGDIDSDGKFEIGGWVAYSEADENHNGPDTSLFKVFKIDKGFPLDTPLTSFFRKTFLAKASHH